MLINFLNKDIKHMDELFDLRFNSINSNEFSQILEYMDTHISKDARNEIILEEDGLLIRTYSYNEMERILLYLNELHDNFQSVQNNFDMSLQITSFDYDITRSVNYEVHPRMLKILADLNITLCFTFAV